MPPLPIFKSPTQFNSSIKAGEKDRPKKNHRVFSWSEIQLVEHKEHHEAGQIRLRRSETNIGSFYYIRHIYSLVHIQSHRCFL